MTRSALDGSLAIRDSRNHISASQTMATNPNDHDRAFDAIVIGSSPLLLIEALCLERQGHRVAIVEKRDRIGGAWYTMPLWEFDCVQPGCHYIERGRKGYAFLEECLGITLVTQTVQAIWFNQSDDGSADGSCFRSPAKWLRNRLLSGRFLSDDMWGIIKSIDRRDLGKFVRAIRRMATSPPYRYPAGGSKALIEALMRRIDQCSIELMTGSCVERVVVGTDRTPNQCVIDNRTYLAKQLIIGRHVYPHLRMADDAEANAVTQYVINVVLRITGEKAVAFDYIEIHRDDLINRVHDITAFTEPRAACSDLLICCNLTKTGTADSEVDATAVFNHLLRCRLLKASSRLVGSHVERYPNPETKDAESTELVTIVNTYDLGVALQRNADRWRSHLER
jgi:hypothetical protein